MTLVKICGITNLEDAQVAVDAGADQLGFNFYKNSHRYIIPREARAIIADMPLDVMKIGVFVNEAIERICEIADVAALDAIQLHGDEDNRFIEEVHMISGLPVIKAFRVSSDFDPNKAKLSNAKAILLDKYSSQSPGGTGETFDWSVAQGVSTLVERLYLAGGLTSENVATAIDKVRPYAVDVCSRIESSPGKKDAEKIEQFIEAVRSTK